MLDRRNRGFVLPAAIFLLVVLGGLAGWLMQLTVATQGQDALAIEGERAYRAAEAGLEVGIYQARQTGASCPDIAQNMVLSGNLARFTASVTCASSTAEEGGVTLTYYTINSVACNQTDSGVCPNANPTTMEYAERHIQARVEGG